jgi:hypothetical protein
VIVYCTNRCRNPAWDIEFELFDLIESFEAIRKVIDDLTELCPTEEEEWEQENQKDDQD